MSARRPWPCWLLPALLCGGAGGYVVVSSVSWPLPEAGAAADELHSSSTEEALPALLEEAGGLWKQSYPASAYREDAALGSGPAARRPGQGAAPSRMFSYRREGGGAPGRAGTARFLARHSAWGFVATRAARGKIQGMPYGNCLLLSDGPINNSTGIPFFYVTPKDNTVTDLLKNPMASLTLPEADGNFCRHPVVRKWPRSYEWFFMKMNIEHIWLQSWYGEVSPIAVEEYLKAVPNKG
uniref:protein CREG2 isoform X2 n=1 Tax=Lonchura striata TaxID=40157 RepID=UPI000B4CBF6E|nr:protein CREG2 isoform X2 [Lonchura striata domestica]